MQVERALLLECPRYESSEASGGRVSNAWATYPSDRDNTGKPVLIPDGLLVLRHEEERRPLGEASAEGWARVPLASW